MNIINKYIDKINFRGISRNKNLSPEFIDKYQDRLSWDELTLNSVLTIN